MSKKLTAILLAVAMLIVALPFALTGVADDVVAAETIPAELNQPVAVIGETIIEEDFDDATAIPEDWQYGKAKGFWVDATASINYGPKVENGALYFDSYMCDAAIGMPDINVADYVFEADLICAESQGSFGLFNNAPAGIKIGTDNLNACLNFVYSVAQTSQITYYQREQGGSQVYVDDEGFTMPAKGTKVNLKIYCINGMNYYYVDGVLRAAYKQNKPQGASSMIGFYNCQGKYGIDKVTVKEIKLNVPEEVTAVEEGDTLYNLADDLAKTEVGATPSNWIYAGAGIGDATHKLPFGYPGTTGSQSLSLKVAEVDGAKVLNFTSSGCDAIAVGPAVYPSSYIYEVTFKTSKESSNMGVANAIWGADSVDKIKTADWFVAKAGVAAANYVSRNAKGVSGSGAVGETKLSYGNGDTISVKNENTFKVICLEGTNYYFINDRYYGTHTPSAFITKYSDGTGGYVGLYTYGGNMNVTAMTVKAIKEETQEEFLPEALQNQNVVVGESLLYEDFEKATAIPEGFELRNPVWDGWAGSAGSWSLTTHTVNGKTNKGIKLTASQDDVILLPTLSTPNYVYEAEITLVNAGNGSFGLLNDMSTKVRAEGADSQGQSGDYGANRMVIYTMEHSSGKTNCYWVNRFGDGASQTNIAKPAEIANLPNTTSALNFKVYSYNGVNYFYINDVYIATFNNLKNFGPENVIGIFTSSAPIFVSKVSVKELKEAETNLGMVDGKAYYKGEVIYDPDFSEFTVGQVPTGWYAGWNGNTDTDFSNSFGYTNTNASGGMKPEQFVLSVKEDATLGKVVEYSTGNADTHLTLPAVNTFNYIYEATVKVSRGGSLGIANNYYAPISKASGGFYNVNYVGTAASKYDYRGNSGGAASAPWNISYNPKSGDVIKYKIISLDGYNYVFYNDIFVAKAPARINRANVTADYPGFYIYNASVSFTDVTITAIHSVSTTVKNTFITVDGNKVDLNSNFTVDKNQSIYKDFIEGAYTDDAAIKFGAVVLKGDEKAFAKLTVDTEGAQVIDGANFSETDDLLKFAVSLDVASADYQKWFSIRPFALVDGIYFYGNGVAYTPANLSNSAYYNADANGKAEIKAVFGNYPEFLYADSVKTTTFTVFADLHYKAGMYSSSIADLNSILKRADDSNSAFILSAGDMTNDMKGSPELVNAFKGFVTEEGELLKAYNVYGNHELESKNSMSDVTPTLTNDANVVWGTADGKMDVNIGYYYADIDGFRLVAVDNQYSWNPNHINGIVVGWDHSLPGSYGSPTASNNAARGYDEGADAVANTKTGSLGDVQMAWLEEVLMDAASKDIPCIVLGHAGYSGLGFGAGSGDAAEVRAVYKKANDANPGTVLMSINGHIHTNNQGWNEGVFYFDVNTVRNAWWQSAKVDHYGAEHTYEFVEYDDQGNPISTTTKSLSTLSMASQTWFSADPLSAVVTLSENGVIEIDGTESSWAYGIEPNLTNAAAGTEPRITSGLFIDCDVYGHALTCVEDGDTHHYKCANPKCDYAEDAVAHTFDKKIAADKYIASNATCEAQSTYYYSCECGKAGTKTFAEGDLGDHNFADGSCSVCQGKLGDINGDGKINVLDLVKCSRTVAGLDEANAFADLDQNGKVDSADATLIRTTIIK